MPDGVSVRVVALQVVVILLGFAAVGAACGLLWAALWDPAPGIVLEGHWYPSPWDSGQEAEFSGTGWYVVLATTAGLVLGALSALFLDRAELATLVAVVVGAVVAGQLMRAVGLAQSPPDPEVLAATAADRTELPSNLRLWWPASWLAFPFGSLVAVSGVFLLLARRGPTGG